MGVTVFTMAVCRQMSCVLHLSLLLYYSVSVFVRSPKLVEGNPDVDLGISPPPLSSMLLKSLELQNITLITIN